MKKVLKKLVCFGLTSLMNFGCSYAMENKIIDKEELIRVLVKDENLIGEGFEGKVFYSEEFPNLVLKKIWFLPNRYTLDCLKKLEGKDLGENLMKVIKVYDKSNIVLEYIDGISYTETLKIKKVESKCEYEHLGLGNITLDLDFFIDKWCVGTIEGMRKIFNITGNYLTDRNIQNFMIRNPKSENPVLVLIDYSFYKNPPKFKTFIEIFLNIMNLNVNKNDTRWEKLYKYLDSIKALDFEPENVKNVIDNLQKIKNKLD